MSVTVMQGQGETVVVSVTVMQGDRCCVCNRHAGRLL